MRTISLAGTLLLAAIAVIGLIAATVLTNAFAPVIQQYGLQVDAANQITQETSRADYAMRQYEWFQQQEEDIDSMRRQIENQRRQIENFKEINDMSDLNYQEQQQYNRMTNRLLGYQNQYETYVADYNARMNVSYQRQYSDELPLEMGEKFWTGDLIP